MAKIFYGDKVYKAETKVEANEAMCEIARQARGTFEGCPCGETGFYVDTENPINIGGGRVLYPILGTMDGAGYGETDDKELFR